MLISGEANGTSSLNVPVVNFDHAFTTKKALSVSSVKMMQVKGNTMTCGVAERTTIRVLMHVKPLNQVAHVIKEAERFHDMDAKHKSDASQSTVLSKASWEYDPTQAAVVQREEIVVTK